MNKTDKLKERENDLISEVDRIRTDLSKWNQEFKNKKQELFDVRKEIERHAMGGVGISDHAVVRYLERKTGLDVETLKKEIVPQKVRQLMNSCGGGTFKVKVDGVVYVVTDNVLVTIY